MVFGLKCRNRLREVRKYLRKHKRRAMLEKSITVLYVLSKNFSECI